MARRPRFFPPGIPQHVIQRGNNRTNCFADDQDFAVYARWLKEYSAQLGVAIHAWVFMSNHVHLLATPTTPDGLSLMMQALGRRYVRYFNLRHGRTGTLWEGRFKPSIVESGNYLLQCYRYIELNPVRAGMVDEPSDYDWSSYRCNGLGAAATLLTPHAEYLKLGASSDERLRAYRAFCEIGPSHELLCRIRGSLSKGLPLGSDHFKSSIEKRYGRKLGPGKTGRPKKG